jgi:hypothetical protein
LPPACTLSCCLRQITGHSPAPQIKSAVNGAEFAEAKVIETESGPVVLMLLSGCGIDDQQPASRPIGHRAKSLAAPALASRRQFRYHLAHLRGGDKGA